MKALVTGGGGFVGSRVAEMLHARGDVVTALGRRSYERLIHQGITCVQADLRDARAVRDACAGQDCVFHVAALARIWGPRREFWEINVKGTEHVIAACREMGVPRLVFTSSPSVVFGEAELAGVDESQPYPERYLAWYPETKAIAERLVLAANGPNLATVAVRPHLVWGPGDPHLIPGVLARARRGKLVQVGDGTNRVDITYIDNAAEAHLLAADALSPGAACAGKAYFVSQGEPVTLWPWLKSIIQAVDAPPVQRTISYRAARRLGAMFECWHRLFRLRREPWMTRFLATQLAQSYYFDISAAKRDLGYQPRVSAEEGFERMVKWLKGDDAGCHARTAG